ncbi:MAG TPA: serine hydrolase [Croceibacterium sp.]|jgi:CubicO group peptidase (beta-lactamase class C family)
MMHRLMVAVLAALLTLTGGTASAHDVAGYWRGTLNVSDQVTLRIGVHVEKGADGALHGTLDSPDQSAFDLPIAQVKQADGTLAFTMNTPPASYSATWDAVAHAWRGTWMQGGASWPLVLTAGEPFAHTAAPALPANWTIPSDAELATLIDTRIALRKGAGMVIGVIDPAGRRVTARGPAGGAPFDGNTEFEIGSMSKIFTSMILADMVLKHEVSLDDPVQKYLPAGATMPSRNGKVITLRNLSLQDSGLPRLPDNMPYADPQDPYADYTEADLLAFLKGYHLTRDPGSQYEYSNLGVGLLGYALARAAHSDYATLLRDRVARPLGMKDTAIALSPDQQWRFAVPHDAYMQPTKPWRLPTLAGAGAIRSTANDMLKFLAAALDPKSPIARHMTLMLSDRRQGAGYTAALGWIVLEPPSGEVLWHDGGTGGFRSNMALQRKTGRAVAVLTNAAAEPSADDIAFHALLGAPVAVAGPVPPAPPTAAQHHQVALTTSQLDHVAGTYRLSPAAQIVVRRDGERLMAQLTGQPSFEIYAEGPLSFFWKVVDAQIRFVEASGKVTGAVLSQGGHTTEATKVE